MKEIEVSAKTVEDAKKAALEQLDVTEDRVKVVVLRKGRSGVLGVGAEEAKIKVTLLDQTGKDNDVAAEAKEILGTLIKCLGMEAEVNISPGSEGVPVTLDIVGDDLGVLIGRHGKALTSLQYILRLIVAEKVKSWVPVNIDITLMSSLMV